MKVKLPAVINERFGSMELEIQEKNIIDDFCIHPYIVANSRGELRITDRLAVTHVGTGLLAGIFNADDRQKAVKLCQELSDLTDWTPYTHYWQKDDIPENVMYAMKRTIRKYCGELISEAGYGN